MAEKRTYITEANVIAVIVVWLAQVCGADMSGEVAAAIAVSIVGVLNLVIRALSKKGVI